MAKKSLRKANEPLQPSQPPRHITLDEFKQHLTNMSSEGVTMRDDGEFSFGFNWTDFVKTRMTSEIIALHQNNLQGLYQQIGVDLKGKSIVDIGCGSGISSVSFANLGCSKITSFDIDEHSVAATKLTKEKFFKGNADWNVYQASILDQTVVQPQSHDIVYSWGVLHHTGYMYQAIRKAAELVKPGGYFHVALYRSGSKLTKSLNEKYRFKFASKEEKIQMLYDRAGQKIFNVKKNRGMNKFHDALDWLGGLPYETSEPEVLHSWLKDKFNLHVEFFQDRNAGGNFTSILRKH